MSNIFNLFSLNKDISINKDIILHENINIISNYFFNCFENNIYNKLKQNTNYKILKSNIKEIFTYSINTYILQHAKEQSKDIDYINNTVSNKSYEPVIDNICYLTRQYIKDNNFDKVLFKFTDLLLEYCGLRNGDLFKQNNGNNKDQIDNLINILIQKYVLKYNPKLKVITKTNNLKDKTNIDERINTLREKLNIKKLKIISRMCNEVSFNSKLKNKLNFNNKLNNIDINKLTNKEKVKLFNEMYNINQLSEKGNKVIDKLKTKLLKTIKSIGLVPQIIQRVVKLAINTAKFLAPSNILTAEKERIKIKTRTTERTIETKTSKDKQTQTPTQTTKQPKEKTTELKSPDKKESQQQTTINNNQQQTNQEQKEQPVQQIKQEEPQKQEQRIKEEKEIQQRLKEEQEKQKEDKEEKLNKKDKEDMSKIEENKLEEKDSKKEQHQQDKINDNKNPEEGLGTEDDIKNTEKGNEEIDEDYSELPKFSRKKKFSGFTDKDKYSTNIDNEQNTKNNNYFQNKFEQEKKNKKIDYKEPTI